MRFRFAFVLVVMVANLYGCDNQEKSKEISTTSNAVSSENWKESDLFETGNYTFLGVKDKLGFIYDEKTTKLYVNEDQKYMWHFWSSDSNISGKLTVKGIHETNRKEEIILDQIQLNGPLNGATLAANSSMKFDKRGIWKLDAYINELYFGSVYINVY